jgi:MarR family 2-MHQ and catechol resistance regulon transcriptional repressor
MSTHHRGDPREVLALDTFIKLVRAQESLHARLSRYFGEVGLTGSQFAVLEALYHLGPMCQRALGSKLLKSSGNITLVIDNLERQGLVRRERDAADRRYITVHLTEAGEARIAHVFPAHAAEITALLSALTEDEQRELGRLCKKLGLAVERARKEE